MTSAISVPSASRIYHEEEILDNRPELATESAELIATRRWDPLSHPFVYQEFNARSLLITQRS